MTSDQWQFTEYAVGVRVLLHWLLQAMSEGEQCFTESGC